MGGSTTNQCMYLYYNRWLFVNKPDKIGGQGLPNFCQKSDGTVDGSFEILEISPPFWMYVKPVVDNGITRR